MLRYFQTFLQAPHFPNDANKTSLASLINGVSVLGALIVATYALLWLIFAPQVSHHILFIIPALLCCGVPFVLIRLGYVRQAGLLFLASYWCITTAIVITVGGTLVPFFGTYVAPIMVAAVLFGWREAIFFVVLTLLTGFVMAIVGQMGLMTAPIATPINGWLTHTYTLLIILANTFVLVRRSNEGRQQSDIELAERQKSDQALRASEERFRLISSVTSDYTFTSRFSLTGELEHTLLTGAFEKITGYSPEEFVVIGGWRTTVHPDDVAIDDRDMLALRSNKPVVSELRIITKSGQTRWVRIYANSVWDEEHQALVGINGAVQDIHDQKLAEQALRESENRFRSLFNGAPYMTSVNTLDGICVELNQAWLEWGHWSTKDVIGQNLMRVLGIDPAIYRHFGHKMRGKGALNSEELIVQRPDGEVRTLLMSARQVIYGSESFLLINAIDVTERKAVEESVHRLNADLQLQTRRLVALNDISRSLSTLNTIDKTLRSVLDKLSTVLPIDGFFVLLYDPETGTVSYPLMFDSGRFWQPPENLMMKTTLSWHVLQEGVPKRINRTPEEMASFVNHNTLVGDTSRVSASLLYAPLILNDIPIGVISAHSYTPSAFQQSHEDFLVATSHQIAIAVQNARLYEEVQNELTERKRVEQEIRLLNAELEQRVDERTRQHEVALKELQAFTYSVSHDLRAPLRAIDGFSQTLLQQYYTDLPPKAQHYLERVQANSQRMSELVDDLLAFARIGRVVPKPQVVNMGALVHQVIAEFATEMPNRQVEFVVDVLPNVTADASLIRQVFVNLLSNAIKYSSRTPHPKVEVGVLTQGEVVYFVRDNGIGFDMQYADKLFGVFQRLHTDENYEGTGIGLATVSRIISAHRGRVWADAEVGQGATFYFTIPNEVSA